MSLDVSLYYEVNADEAARAAEILENFFLFAAAQFMKKEFDDRCRGGWNGELPKYRVFDYNITHNLNTMAEAAGVYKHLWRPEELNISRARDLIEPLQAAYDKLLADPKYFKTFDAENGWGTYQNLLDFVDCYLKACKQHPDAFVEASR